jgi:cytoskeletal protein CcmA (bactofilin family)
MLGKSESRSNEVGLFLGREASFQGNMTFKGMARLDGKFDGEILSENELVVGESAIVNAEIKVGTVIINGQLNGNVSATVKAEIHSTGRLHGNIATPVLVIEEGGILDGMCKMAKREEIAPNKVTPIKESNLLQNEVSTSG